MKKNAIITGASRGIGRQIALHLASSGYNITANYLSSDRSALLLKEEIEKLGRGCLLVKGDISCTETVKRLFNETHEKFGSVDLLVNNAGVSKEGLLTDISDEEFEKIMSVNFSSVFKTCREAVPYMLKNHNGCIINISSMWGICGASCESVYSASKAAIIVFSRSLAKELGPSGIRINCIAPGLIDTDMNKNLSKDDINELVSQTPIERIGTPCDIAKAVLFLASDDASFITGQTLSVDGGFIS